MNRTRKNQFSLRLSDEEHALFSIKQRESGLSKTDFLVEMLRDTSIKVYRFNEAINPLYRKLQKIGVNLNQIAVTANSGFFPEAERYVFQMQSEYSAVMESLKAFLENPPTEAKLVKINEVV